MGLEFGGFVYQCCMFVIAGNGGVDCSGGGIISVIDGQLYQFVVLVYECFGIDIGSEFGG